MIQLTTQAAKKVRALAQKQGKPGAFLRLKVVSGGCSGMSYEFAIADDLKNDDIVTETEGAKAVVDPKSDLFVNGSTVDYAESLMKSGFEIKNPKAASSCSCGASFTTADEAPQEESFNV